MTLPLTAVATAKRIDLNWHEVALASQVGLRRHIEALRLGLSTTCSPDDCWSAHVEGACGEFAFAKSENLFWTPTVNTFKKIPDVGPYHVRTRSRPTYELLIRDDDAPDDPDAVFVLVRGRVPTFDVVGWLCAGDAKRPEWRQAHGGRAPAYFVPDRALQPLSMLPLRRR